MAGPVFPVSVKGVILHRGQVILLRNERGEWELPGGRLEPGEQPEACLHREIFEELYLDVAVGALLDCWTYRITQVNRPEPIGEVVIVSYACRLKHDLGALSFSDEHQDVGLFSVDYLSGDALSGLALPDGYRRAIAKAAAGGL